MLTNKILTIDVGSVWVGPATGSLQDSRIEVTGGRITRVGRRSEFGDPQGDHLSFPNHTMVPGLIDTHCHLMFGDGSRSYEAYIREDSDDLMLLRAARNAQLHLAAGVTTLRDVGARNRILFSLKEGLAHGLFEGPRVQACGRPLTITGGHFWWCNQECDGVEGVRQAARQLIKEGADLLKFMASGGGTKGTNPTIPSFSAEEIRAGTDEARNARIMTTAHCEATASVERAIAGGIHCVEHAGFQEPDGTRTYRPDLVQQMAERGIYYSPTIQTAYGGVRRFAAKERLTADEERRLGAQRYKLDRKLANLEKMFDSGVKVIMGTDAISHFGDYVIGLELFCHACMSPEQALNSATAAAAEAIGLDHEIGTVEAGKAADLVIVAGDPLADISNLRKVDCVIRNGRIFRGAALGTDYRPLPETRREAENVAQILA